MIDITKIKLLGEERDESITKLALVSSMAISANAMAMQAMDDASLSAATGQDGISIGIGISKVEIGKVFIHDNDGLATANGGTAKAGAIVIQGNGKDNADGTAHVNKVNGIVIGANYDKAGAYLLPSRNLADLQIDTDANSGNAFINVAAQVSGLDINIGQIGVVASADMPATGATSIRRGGTGTVRGDALPISMVQLSATMVGGLEIKDLGILDNSTKTGTRAAGEIFVESIKVADANSLDLTLNQKISVIGEEGANKGYIRMISTSGAHDTYVKGVHLGSRNAASIGDFCTRAWSGWSARPA